MRVFEQRGGTDGDGLPHHVEVSLKVSGEPFGKPRLQERAEDVLVRDVRESRLVKFVRVHELVEDVRAKHDGLGNHDIRVVVGVEFGMTLDDVV